MFRLLLYVALVGGSFVIPRLLAMLTIMLTGQRELGMSLGFNIGFVITWLLFPLIMWRPFTKLNVVTVVAVIFAAMWLNQLPLFAWLKLPGDHYGIYHFAVTYSFYCILLYELSTHFIIDRPVRSPAE